MLFFFPTEVVVVLVIPCSTEMVNAESVPNNLGDCIRFGNRESFRFASYLLYFASDWCEWCYLVILENNGAD